MVIRTTPLVYMNSKWRIGNISIQDLATSYGTPLYVLDFNRIEENYRALATALQAYYSKSAIRYATKANSNLAVLHFLKKLGSEIDCASEGEVLAAKHAGFNLENAIYTGVNVTDKEFRTAAENALWINCNSLSELNRALRLQPEKISLRYKPGIGQGHKYTTTGDVDSKFGLFDDEMIEGYRRAKQHGVTRFGIHMHIGSGGADANNYIPALEKLLLLARTIKKQLGIEFEFVDIGGGLPVPYKPQDEELNPDQFFRSILTLFKQQINEYDLGEPLFCIEPGRYIVCDAGVLLTRVTTLKENPVKRFIGVDAGMHLLIRPVLYGAYHEIVNCSKSPNERTEKYDIVGPICESGDFLAQERQMVKTNEGDILAILNAGAYGYCMSSNYNLRMRPMEVGIYKGKVEVIREAEKLEDYLTKQRIPF